MAPTEPVAEFSASPFLLELPVEILHHIFDFLDLPTIIFSVSNVCIALRAIVMTYNRYELDLSSISKSDFHRLCHWIEPSNLISLIISDDHRTPGQIPLFFSQFVLDQFSRLTSLTLLDIDDDDLNKICQHRLPSTLLSLTIRWRDAHFPSQDTLSLLALTLSQLHLRNLELINGSYAMENLAWPFQFTMEHLTLMYITHRQFCLILQQCPCLRSVTLNHCSMHSVAEDFLTGDIALPLTSLRSLTLMESRLSMNGLISVLCLTPMLSQLKIIGSPDSFDTIADGSRWERFIRSNLVQLNRFEFFFTNTYNVYYQSTDIQLLMARFQTSFWLEEKSWLVTCDYISYLNQVMLYTVPLCTHDFTYESEANRISFSNTILTFDHQTIVHQVHTLNTTLTKLKLATLSVQERMKTNEPLFRNVRKLVIDVDQDWSIDYIEYLSSLVDLSQLEKLVFNPDFQTESMENTIEHVRRLMALCSHLQSLSIHPYISFDQDDLKTMQIISSLIPSEVKYLEISVKTLESMFIILNDHPHLWSLKYLASNDQSIPWPDFLQSLNEKRRDFSSWSSFYSLHIWFNTEDRMDENLNKSSSFLNEC